MAPNAFPPRGLSSSSAGLPAIELSGIRKVYDGTIALAQLDHAFDRGRVHALVGKNGSGKSTLVKMLSGAIQPTTGHISVNGTRVRLESPNDAFASGITTVHQELSLVPSLSISENIYLGRLPHKRAFGKEIVDWQTMHDESARLLHEMGLDIDPRQLVGTLSVGQQQVIEIVKAMSFDPPILLLDEPTSALAAREVEQVFALIRRLRERGVTIIYITHKMNELFSIADTCTVLRDGRYIGTVEMAGVLPGQIVEMMFGDVAKAKRSARRSVERADPILRVEGLTRSGAFENVSFELYRGEVMGLAGLLGSGRTEVLRAIFGADHVDSGVVILDGETIPRPSPRMMKRRGLGYTPENRKEFGLVQMLSSHDNLCLASLARISSHGFVTRRRETPFVERQIHDLAIKVPDPMLPVSSLSGGNQQKIVIGNWMNTGPKVMFFDEPSRGVDVYAKQQIFEIMWQQASRGLAAVFVSSELEELLDVADRILVMHRGRVVAETLPETTTLTALYRICMEGLDDATA